MKKLYASIVAISLLASIGYGMDEKEKSGFFAGVDLSGASYYYNMPSYNSSPSFPTHTDYSFNYGIKGGYQFYGSEKHGLRVGLHLNLGNYNSKDENITTSSSSGSTGGGGQAPALLPLNQNFMAFAMV